MHEINSGDYIVNLDATQDGIGNSGSDITGNSLVGQPNTVDVPSLSFTLAAGTYKVTNDIGSSFADANFSSWNFESANATPWVWEFLAVEIPDASTSAGTVLANYTPAPYTRFATQAGAAAYGADFTATFTLPTEETVAFALDDDILGDNAGGVVFELTDFDDVPEASTFGMAGLGLLFLVGLRRIAKR